MRILKRRGKQGNTLGEYGLLLGVLALASVGALSAFGNSVEGLFQPFSSACPQRLCDLVNLNFGPIQAEAQPVIKAAQNGLGDASGAVAAGVQNAPTATSAMPQILTGDSSGGTNATSVDGSQQQAGLDAVRATWLRAQKLSALAQTATDSTLKNYLTVLANDAYWLSGAQANYEYHAGGNAALKDLGTTVDNGTVNMNTTLATIKGWGNTLQLDFNRLSQDASIAPQDKAVALQLASQILSGNTGRYAETYSQVPDTGERLKITGSFDQLKTVALQTLDSGGAEGAPAVKTSIQNGSALASDESPESTP